MELKLAEFLDTSNFDPSHPLYNLNNRREVGKFKVETGSIAPLQFVGLRASLLVVKGELDDDDDDDYDDVDDGTVKEQVKTAAKGIPKAYVRKYIRHKRFLAALRNKKPGKDTARFRRFQSKMHVVRTIEIEKVCLNAWDDKRYILDGGVGTLAHGHVRIRNGPC